MALVTYQSERFIAAQVASYGIQDRAVDEVVVADDGSTDATLRLVRATAKEAGLAESLRVMDPGNRLGVVRNVERALAAAIGDVILLSDHDDVWHPNRVSRGLAPLTTVPPGRPAMSFSDARIIDGDGNPTGTTLLGSLRLGRGERRAIRAGRAVDVLLRRNVVTGATAAVTRELVDLARPFPESWVHDEWLAMMAAISGELILIDEPLIDYRVHASNQIGVDEPTAAARLRRAARPRADRYVHIHRKYADLLARLKGTPADAAVMRLLRTKVAFEDARSRYPAARWRRLLPILRQARHYRRFSSQRLVDLGRDLLQPA